VVSGHTQRKEGEQMKDLVTLAERYRGFKKPKERDDVMFIKEAMQELYEFRTNFEVQHAEAVRIATREQMRKAKKGTVWLA
jgi:hypothetical protein